MMRSGAVSYQHRTNGEPHKRLRPITMRPNKRIGAHTSHNAIYANDRCAQKRRHRIQHFIKYKRTEVFCVLVRTGIRAIECFRTYVAVCTYELYDEWLR